MALGTKKVGIHSSQVAQRGGVRSLGARRLRGASLGHPLKASDAARATAASSPPKYRVFKKKEKRELTTSQKAVHL